LVRDIAIESTKPVQPVRMFVRSMTGTDVPIIVTLTHGLGERIRVRKGPILAPHWFTLNAWRAVVLRAFWLTWHAFLPSSKLTPTQICAFRADFGHRERWDRSNVIAQIGIVLSMICSPI